MPGKRIPDLGSLTGAGSASTDDLVIFDTSTNTTKRISRVELATAISAEIPFTPSGIISSTTVSGAINEIVSDLAAAGGAALVGNTAAGTIAASTVQAAINELAAEKPQILTDITALRAFSATGSLPTQIQLTNNHTAGDGGGLFRYDSTDTTTADNGGTVLVDAASRRWKRQWDGAVHSNWFYAPHPSTPQTTALQAFLNAGPNLFVNSGTVVSGPVTIPANVTVTGTRDAILKFNTTSAAKHVELLGDNITLDGFTVDGSYTTETYAGGFTSGHFGICAIGTSGTNINNLTLRNLLVKNYGDTGVYTEFVNNKVVANCTITRCGYAGAQGLSTIGAFFHENYVYNIYPGDGSQNCYGVTETARKSPFQRVPQNIIMQSNRIDDVVPWAGLDLHFAKHCVVDGNIITNCSQPIAYEGAYDSTGSPTPPLPPSLGDDIVISNNTIYGWSGASTTRSGQTYYKTGGIVAKGTDFTYQATLLTITGNNVTGMGDTRPGTGGAITFTNWDGVICSHNNLRDSHARGISTNFSISPVTKLDCSHNTIVNVAVNNGVCRGIDLYDTDGSGVNNSVTGLASGSERLYQASLTRRFKFIQLKEKLLENTIYYVRADGNNNNIGTVNTAGGAFLTIQAAIDHIANNVDTNGKTVTIQIANGTWTTAIAAKSYEGGGSVILKGSSGTPSNVLLQTSADCFTAVDVLQTSGVDQGPALGRYTLDGIKFESSAGSAIWAVGNVLVDFQNCHFGACANHHVAAFFNARVAASGNYSITGSAATHLNAVGGTIDIRSRTVTLTGTPAFSVAFAQSARGAHIMVSSATFSGAATGVRFNSTLNGVIFTNNAGATFLPGNASGTVSTGGRYDGSATDPENEILSTIVPSASAVSLTSATAASVATLNLGPGTWRVTGVVGYNPGATTSITVLMVAINTAGSMPSPELLASGRSQQAGAAYVPGANIQAVATGEAIFTFTAASTTVHLATRAEFTVSTLSAFGKIQAQRLA